MSVSSTRPTSIAMAAAKVYRATPAHRMETICVAKAVCTFQEKGPPTMKSVKVSQFPVIRRSAPGGGFANRTIEGSPIWIPERRRYEATFSGLDSSLAGPPFWRTFGASSPDGVRWTLMNDGRPIIPVAPGD